MMAIPRVPDSAFPSALQVVVVLRAADRAPVEGLLPGCMVKLLASDVGGPLWVSLSPVSAKVSPQEASTCLDGALSWGRSVLALDTYPQPE